MIAALFWLCAGSIVYTYVGYPLLLTLIARVRSTPPTVAAELPSITLLIAAYNEEAVLTQKLDNVLSLDYPRDLLQVIVMADGSSDSTPTIVEQYAAYGIELSYLLPRRGKMAAINRAMPQAQGEIVVFSDANNLYEANALRELVAPFADPAVGAVSGAKVIMENDGALGDTEGLYWRYESFIKEWETRLGSCAGVAGEIFALRRVLFVPPPERIINDDFYLAMRLIRRGFRVVYAPRALSYERVSPSVQDEVVRRSRIVAGRYQAIALWHHLLPLDRPMVVWQIVSHKFLRPLVPIAMIGALLSNVLAVLWPSEATSFPLLHLAPPYNWLLLGLQLLFYAVAWLGGHVAQRGLLGKLLFVPTYLVYNNFAALVGLYRFVKGRQTPLWERVPRRHKAQQLPAEPAALPSAPQECAGRKRQ